MLILGLVASLLAISYAAPCTPPLPATYASAVVFGDSFSDNGNVFTLTNRTWPADPAYYAGRFSNGPVWAEDLAVDLGVPLLDYAYGGATTSNALVRGFTGAKADILVPSLEDQVDEFLLSGPHNSAPLDRSLFILWGGANDVFANRSITPAQSAAVLARLVAKLQDAGGASFLLVGSPDLSMIPWDSYIDGASREALHNYSVDLADRLVQLSAASGAGVEYAGLDPLFRSFGFYEQGWKAAGFDKFAMYGSCLVGAYTKAPRSLCKDPDKRVFWDEFHPTVKTHKLIARALRKAL